MKHKAYFVVTALVLMLTCASAFGVEPPTPFTPSVYQNEGLFVKIPATIGNVIGWTGGGIAGAPAGVVMAIGSGFDAEALTTPSRYTGWVGGTIGEAVVGLPFYVVKKVCYDLPKKAIQTVR